MKVGLSSASRAIFGSFCPLHWYHSGCACAKPVQLGLPSGLPHVGLHVWIPGFTGMEFGTNAPPLVPILRSKTLAKGKGLPRFLCKGACSDLRSLAAPARISHGAQRTAPGLGTRAGAAPLELLWKALRLKMLPIFFEEKS